MSIPLVSAITLSKLQDRYDGSLQDTAQIMTYTAPVANAFGTGRATYASGSTIRCMFREWPSPETLGAGFGGAQVGQIDGTVFLPRDQAITNRDRIKVTKLRGVTITPARTYEIIAGPQQDQVHNRAALRLVTDGTDT